MASELTDEAIDLAIERGGQLEASFPTPSSARYDAASGRIVVEFTNGSAFMVPARALQDLENASNEDLAAVEIENGYALRWDRLDVDFTIPGLMAGMFGTARFMASAAGRARSTAKAEAARKNGRKGGQPRKVIAGTSSA
ncbi:DUF2442 domain-containing protein [Jiella pacifica]|mgnify:CR=1 FL=1|uniref:DUF2442 domain-containing protein n=1 Tax=Jiella pacifica TaxID=2696469 RepID=A0A6N9SV33_9HYPH|nr:DUF2442 domain-containing protein [Jiella pacifica]NDW02910.1 DUF2442 domain-containing protein [Jiella pacifica]